MSQEVCKILLNVAFLQGILDDDDPLQPHLIVVRHNHNRHVVYLQAYDEGLARIAMKDLPTTVSPEGDFELESLPGWRFTLNPDGILRWKNI